MIFMLCGSLRLSSEAITKVAYYMDSYHFEVNYSNIQQCPNFRGVNEFLHYAGFDYHKTSADKTFKQKAMIKK